MRLISKDMDYAITALCYVAKRGGQAIAVSELARELETSYAFLRKMLHILQKQGFVNSQRGKGGIRPGQVP